MSGGPTLSAGQVMVLKHLRMGAKVTHRLGPLKGCVPRLEGMGLIERVAPGNSPTKTMVQLTDAGRAAIPPLKPKD